MASKGINKVIVLGFLSADPEVRYSQSGKAIASLSIPTSDSWKDQSGQIQERTEWHKISMFGKLAEVAGEYLRKGSQVYIEGKLQTRKWQDKEGKDRYTTEIIVDGFDGKMQMLGGRNGQSDGGNQQQQPQQQNQQPQYQQQQRQPMQNQGGRNQAPQQPQPHMVEPDFEMNDDIPFRMMWDQYPALLNCM